MRTQITDHLLAWYQQNRRDLPWRKTTDPYATWVAEIMLQQTRVDTVIPYYLRWMEAFPDVTTLAAANQQQALSVWEGLGYYSRARNLHRAAVVVQEKNGGQIPDSLKELESLPGIGKAGAADILSIAFGQDLATVDGNIRRVVARLLDLEWVQGTAGFETAVQSFVDENLPPGEAGDYNQAWMDLGATICVPERPDCASCPLRDDCQAFGRNHQELRPVKKEKAPIPTQTVAAGILLREGRVLLAHRHSQGLLGGLWEYPGGKQLEGESLSACLARELREELGIEVQVGAFQGTYRHAYTHFRVVLSAYFCDILSGTPQPLAASELAWASLTQLSAYPMGKIDRMISRSLPVFHPRE